MTELAFNPLSPLAGIIEGKEQNPPRIIIYGTPKIGKSTFAANAPSPIFIPTEKGLGQINCRKFPLCESFEQVKRRLESVIMEEHDFGTVVIDSLDWLEKLIFKTVCERWNVASIELAANGYGKGYTAALSEWAELTEMLDACNTQRGMAVVLIAHSQIKKFEHPGLPAYDRYSPKLHEKTSGPYMSEWADAILFAHRKVRVAVEKVSPQKTRATASPVGAGGGERILRCVEDPTALAGNRYGLPDEIPLDWNALAEGIAASWEANTTATE